MGMGFVREDVWEPEKWEEPAGEEGGVRGRYKRWHPGVLVSRRLGKKQLQLEFWEVMKLLHEKEDAINKRKLIKSQVEKRRRERMNYSLEQLKTMLLKEPQQVKGGTQHRVEKAEILEHTVLFLQKNTKERNAKAAGQKPSFQDGFSTCLQRASRFLGPKGRGLWIGPALDATFAGRFTRSHKDPADDQSKPSSSSLTHTKSILQMLRQMSKSSQQVLGVSSFAYPYRFPVQQSFPVPQQPQTQSGLEMRAERPQTKEGSSQSSPTSQTLWRPWP